MEKISVVIPCYNSEKTIGIVVEETICCLLKHNESIKYEIILVNDFSTDNTKEVIYKLCAENQNIKGLSFSKNFGQPAAMLAGFSIVCGDIVVYSDDDGQTPIDEVYNLINKLNEGYDMVFAKFSEKKNSFFQNIGTKLNNAMANYLIDKPKDIHMGNFWVCKSFVVKESVKCTNPYPYLAGIFLSITRNMTIVHTTHRPRLLGKTNYTFKKMISLWLNGFTAFSVKPLRIASLVGFITAISGFIYIVVLVFNKIKYPEIPMGYSSIMSTLLFVGGMIMMMLGLVGEYIGRIYININKKPQFVIKEKIN